MLRNGTRLATLLALLLAGPAAAAERTDHRQYQNAKPAECTECHRGSGVFELHFAPDFGRTHRLEAQKANANCTDCHQHSQCLDCHKGGNVTRDVRAGTSRRGEAMPTSHTPDFITTHKAASRDDPRSCFRCHEERFCSDCHTRWRDRRASAFAVKSHAPRSFTAPDAAWVASHRSEARRNLKGCESCHPSKSNCSSFACHPGLGGR